MGVKTIIIRGRLSKHQRFSDTLRAPQKLISLQIPTSYLLSLTSYLLPKQSFVNPTRYGKGLGMRSQNGGELWGIPSSH